MNVTTFPKLKQRHIVLWRICIWLVLTFWSLPNRLLLRTLDYPLNVIYNLVIFIRDTLVAFFEVSCDIGATLVRYFKVCKYLVHATAEDKE